MRVELQEAAQTGPILFLTRYWVAFQGQQTQTTCPAAEAAQRREPGPPIAPGTKVSPPASHHGTKVLEYDRNPFRSKGSISQNYPMLKPPYHKWPSSKALWLEPAPPAFLHTSLLPQPLKTHLKHRIRDTDLSLASCLLAGLLSNKSFLFPQKPVP